MPDARDLAAASARRRFRRTVYLNLAIGRFPRIVSRCRLTRADLASRVPLRRVSAREGSRTVPPATYRRFELRDEFSGIEWFP